MSLNLAQTGAMVIPSKLGFEVWDFTGMTSRE